MIAVMVLAGLMAYLVAGFAIYALWVPSYLKDDTFGWALLNVVFWPTCYYRTSNQRRRRVAQIGKPKRIIEIPVPATQPATSPDTTKPERQPVPERTPA